MNVCISTQYAFITTKFHNVLLRGFRGVNCADKKTGLMDKSKTLFSAHFIAQVKIKGQVLIIFSL